MTSSPTPSEEPTEAQLQEDPFEELRRELPDFAEYDEVALEQYRSFSYYFASRRAGAARGVAKELTCQRFGHDAPRGLCRRCGLGVDLTKADQAQERQRITDRDTWLSSRH